MRIGVAGPGVLPIRHCDLYDSSLGWPTMNELDEFIAASAFALALPIDPLWRPAIRSNLQAALGFAVMVADFKLPDDAEPAPVFRS
jgi:hypothetical protein